MYVLSFKMCFFKNLCGLTDQLLIPIISNRNACTTHSKTVNSSLFYYYKLSVFIIDCVIFTCQI